MSIAVEATEEEVLNALQGVLTAEELGQLRIERGPGTASAEPFAPAPRHAEPITTATVVIWVVSGVVGSLAYDAAKSLARKVRQILSERFGAARVKPDPADDAE